MREIESVAHVTFPRSVRVLSWHAERGIDAYLEMKFEMPAVDWPAFVESSPLRGVALEEKNRQDLGADHDDWDPGKPTHLRAARVELPEVKSLTLGVDDSRADRVVVYIVWFST